MLTTIIRLLCAPFFAALACIVPPGRLAWRRRPRAARLRGPFAALPAPDPCVQVLDGRLARTRLNGASVQNRDDMLAQKRMQSALASAAIRARFGSDLRRSLTMLGLPGPRASVAAEFIIATLRTRQALALSRQDIIAMLQSQIGALAGCDDPDTCQIDFHTTVARHQRKHEETLFWQLTHFTGGMGGACMLDFGAGDGVLDMLISKHVKADIVAVDLEFQHRAQFGGAPSNARAEVCGNLPAKPFDGALAINVLAHDLAQPKSLARLWRMLRPNGTLFVVETIPFGNDSQTLTESLECSFLNDYLLRRVFLGELPGPLPLPIRGLYEHSIEGWERRFRAAGFEIGHCRHLGRSNDINPNWNVLFVLNKPAALAG